MMRRSVGLAIFVFLLSAATSAARAQDQPLSPSAQPQPGFAPAAAPSNIPVPKPQAPRRRARRVITNDDIEGIGSIYRSAFGPDLTYINDCDRSCFEAVRVAARIYPSGVQWKKDLLDAIERVKDDGPWQGLLSDFGAVRGELVSVVLGRSHVALQNVAVPAPRGQQVTAPRHGFGPTEHGPHRGVICTAS